ncbi:hypothetical protein EDD18DRAFT_1418697 [Armillaria luteobubalina]|uniref:Uncharacterized protein n=1 Tax=Armillaria luteobubalina TaxID=153913 RepID=A0AA39PV46_9AGAR|nr:hypothetical protein EDD18DRAFT_1418697 [Armillaria luteobubalina]
MSVQCSIMIVLFPLVLLFSLGNWYCLDRYALSRRKRHLKEVPGRGARVIQRILLLASLVWDTTWKESMRNLEQRVKIETTYATPNAPSQSRTEIRNAAITSMLMGVIVFFQVQKHGDGSQKSHSHPAIAPSRIRTETMSVTVTPEHPYKAGWISL